MTKLGKFLLIFGTILSILCAVVGIKYYIDAQHSHKARDYAPRQAPRETPWEFQPQASHDIQSQAQRNDENPEAQNNNANAAEYVDEAESDVDRALRFMKFKFELDTEQRAIDLIRHWTYFYTSWKESDFGHGNSREYFYGPIHFHKSKSDFYSLVTGSMRNKNVLTYLVSTNTDKISQRNGIISRNAFVRSGASDCLRILLWAYEDIYSHEDHSRRLREMYDIMIREPGEYYYSFPESYFEELRPFMSNNVVNDINRLCIRNTQDTEWATASMAAWAYSFWARRHNDRVDGTVHGVLKIIERAYH